MRQDRHRMGDGLLDEDEEQGGFGSSSSSSIGISSDAHATPRAAGMHSTDHSDLLRTHSAPRDITSASSAVCHCGGQPAHYHASQDNAAMNNVDNTGSTAAGFCAAHHHLAQSYSALRPLASNITDAQDRIRFAAAHDHGHYPC